MDQIFLNGLVFFGRHGCYASENELGQKFVVDIELSCDLSAAAASDKLEDTLDYVRIYNLARETVEGPPVKLLETVAGRIADAALGEPGVSAVKVRINKPHIALPGALDGVGVEISRSKIA